NAQYEYFVKAGGYGEERYWTEAVREGVWKNGKVKGRYAISFKDRPAAYRDPLNYPNHPVVGVMWHEAIAFTRWLEQEWRKRGILPEGWKINLPSEAEWEKAARGGKQIPREPVMVEAGEVGHISVEQTSLSDNLVSKRAYPWGNKDDIDRANIEENKIGATSAVGCFRHGAGPYGCEELIGNVWEWTRSINKEYPYNPGDGREDLSKVNNNSGIT
ncbi:MAG: formylglycine-generating enzyme family protein, partial [bacterium]|nr:formylglycine-generating enzyme family protein [bacterium]